jgi:hypothetical protein
MTKRKVNVKLSNVFLPWGEEDPIAKEKGVLENLIFSFFWS